MVTRRTLSRRAFLGGAAAASTAATLASWLPSVVDRAYAAADPAGCGDLSDIEHLVFVMQENRSFDHYFGTLSGVRGFDDPTMPTQVVGGKRYPVYNQFGWEPGTGVTSTGYTMPFPLQVNLTTDGEFLNDPTHDWLPQHQSWNGGSMDSFVKTHVEAAYDGPKNGPIVMSYYNRETLPFYYALADAFTICDNYHCSVLGPTYPNRLYWMTAMLDPHGTGGGPMLQTLGSVLPSANIFSWKTMPEVLEEAGVSWKVYQSTDAIEGVQGGLLMDNVLRLFKQYGQLGTPLNTKGLLPTIEDEFVEDILLGQLPAVSWLVPDFTQCEHPAAPPELGALAITTILSYLLDNPAVWEKTALIISYDENGGFFDHVPPPTAPAGTPDEYITVPIKDPSIQGIEGGVTGPIGLGFRVPCLVVSPYTRGGLVYSGTLDHTSQLRLIETRFGTPIPNLSAWRRQTVGDLTGAFNFAATPDSSRPTLPVPIYDLGLSGAAVFANPLNLANALAGTEGDDLTPYPVPTNSVPHQEAGPARPAPSGVIGGGGICGANVHAADVAAGIVSATPAGGTPASPTASDAVTAAPGPASSAEPGAASSQGGNTLADTGLEADEIAKGVALVALGGVVTALAHELPGPHQSNDAAPPT
jgi:phospholipase C